jgi:hypothetical protein
VWGARERAAASVCGAFEIDQAAGTRTKMHDLPRSACDGDRAASPDGKYIVRKEAKHLVLDDSKDGSRHALKDFRVVTGWNWSPDSRWLAVVDGGRLILVDALNPSGRHRSLGSNHASSFLAWSPDSQRILLSNETQFSCSLFLYFGSLQVIDVLTGKRAEVKGSHCEISGGWVGWVNRMMIVPQSMR